MLNRNRCILCTRCVRFMREVDTDAQINIVDRGYGSEIATFQEQGVHSLLSGNLMDVCPVGAITTRDYRFKARPWDNPDAVDTICTLCEKGCNTTAWLKAKPEWAKGAQLIRMTPRFNPEVNSYWMCDIGRFDYRWIEGDDRLQRPLLRTEAGTLEPTDWRNAVTEGRRSRHRRGRGQRRCDSSCPRTPRSKSSRSSAGSAARLACPRKAWRSAGGGARSRSRRTPSSRFRRSTRRTCVAAMDLGFPVRSTGNRRPRSRRRSAGRSNRAGVHVLYVFDPGPEGSIGDVSWIIEARRAGSAGAPHRAGRPDDAAGEGGRHRAAGRRLGREGRRVRQRAGPAAGSGARDRASGRGAAKTGRSSSNVGVALGAPLSYTSSQEVRAEIAAALREQRTLRRADDPGVRAAGLGPALAAGVEPVRALEVGLHVPGSAAGEVRRQSRRRRVAECDSSHESRVASPTRQPLISSAFGLIATSIIPSAQPGSPST